MIDDTLLSLLACPETKKNLVLADQATVDRANEAIAAGKLRNRDQQVIKDKIDGGLLREGDPDNMYPVRNNIPILLVEELIDIKGLNTGA